MSCVRIPVELPVQPWFADHAFAGRIVLPAVEAMLLLAGVAGEVHPEADIRLMEQARFTRFLVIEPGSTIAHVAVECGADQEGGVVASLLGRVRCATMTRMMEYARIRFRTGQGGSAPLPDRVAARLGGQPAQRAAVRQQGGDAADSVPCDRVQPFRVAAERVYRELVPFGRAYRNLQGELLLTDRRAQARVAAPLLPETGRSAGQIGSPFPLDGAFHAACVLGQRTEDYVPFPVSFMQRTVVLPTRPGREYEVLVELRERGRDFLVFDLELTAPGGAVHEVVRGLRMQDVSGGTIAPPAWIRRQGG